MPAETERHPNRDTLSRFLSGALDEPIRAQIESHLLSCEQCAEALSTVDGGDELESLARGSRRLWASDDTDVPETGGTLGRQASDAGVPDALVDHPRYIVDDCIGVGGMGTVYRATHRVMDRPVAIKVIHPSLVESETARNQFRIEVRAAAKLSHPNIVTAYDAETLGDTSFLAMEFVQGRSLAELVQEDGPLDPREAVRLIRQAACGLQHAHSQGLVHRDVKPSNLLLVELADGSSMVKVLDFGLARISQESSLPSGQPGSLQRGYSRNDQVMLGTLNYIAPEQSGNASQADARSDIYSLGCTLHFLLTGQPPSQGQTLLQRIHASKSDPAIGVREAHPAISKEIATLLDRMLAEDPGDRFQDMDALLETMDAKSESFDDNTTGSHRGRASRRLIKVTLLAIVAGLVTAISFIMFRQPGTPSEPADRRGATDEEHVTTAAADADVHALIVVPPVDVWNAEYEPIRDRLREVGIAAWTGSVRRTVTALHSDDSRTSFDVDFLISETDASNFDVVIICGGQWEDVLEQREVAEDLKQLLDEQLESNFVVAAICRGQMVLGHLGLLRGVNTARPPENILQPQWEAFWVDNASVVTDGKIVTASDDDDALTLTEEIRVVLGIAEQAR